MSEKSLSASIDRLARRKADAFMVDTRERVMKALESSWRSKPHGCGFSRYEDVRAVLRQIADGDKAPLHPSDELVNGYRADIVDSLLNSISAAKELVAMQGETAANNAE